MKGKSTKMVSARQFAKLNEVPYTTVIFWLKKEAIPGAEKQEVPFGRQGFIWLVPESAPLPELPRGPKPKSESNRTAAKKALKKIGKAKGN
jgi:hypothetical protein